MRVSADTDTMSSITGPSGTGVNLIKGTPMMLETTDTSAAADDFVPVLEMERGRYRLDVFVLGGQLRAEWIDTNEDLVVFEVLGGSC